MTKYKVLSDEPRHKRSVETLHHYSCAYCDNWWSVADEREESTVVRFCPSCGKSASIERCDNVEERKI